MTEIAGCAAGRAALRWGLYAVVLAAVGAGWVSAAPARQANLLIRPAIEARHITCNGGGHAVARLLPHGGPGGARAVEITVAQQPRDPWNIQYMVAVGAARHPGDRVNLSFQFRSATPGQKVRLAAVLQYTHAPWTRIFNVSAGTGAAWKTVREKVSILNNIPPSNIAVTFDLGSQTQKLLIADIHLTFHGHHAIDMNFGGPWLKPALARIAKYRMALLDVQVTDGRVQ